MNLSNPSTSAPDYYDDSYYDIDSGNVTSGNATSGNDTYEDPYDDPDYEYAYYSYGDFYYYQSFEFERPIYLYIWVILIVVTTLANILVIIVLQRRNMRNATNIILIAVAISDSLTGLVTLPVTIHAYQKYTKGDLELTKEWCEAFMVIRYFISRGFHTMSIWLTVVLGFQRLISVSFPFRAQSMFSIQNTIVIIVIVMFLSPFLHIYHAFDSKVIEHPGGGGFCEWKIETPCLESCAYLWLVIILMHFIPCILLVIFTVAMVVMMHEATKKMIDSQMIANKANLHRRHLESKRISCIVIAVVIVFLIPEIPYGIFLLVQLSLKHSKKDLLELRTSRGIICAYEILLVFSFHANFWIYLIINRRFRRGLQRTFEPVELIVYNMLRVFGIHKQKPSRRRDSTSLGRTYSDAQSAPSQTANTRISHSNSITSAPLEMRTYHFKAETNANNVLHKNQHENEYTPTPTRTLSS